MLTMSDEVTKVIYYDFILCVLAVLYYFFEQLYKIKNLS